MMTYRIVVVDMLTMRVQYMFGRGISHQWWYRTHYGTNPSIVNRDWFQGCIYTSIQYNIPHPQRGRDGIRIVIQRRRTKHTPRGGDHRGVPWT